LSVVTVTNDANCLLEIRGSKPLKQVRPANIIAGHKGTCFLPTFLIGAKNINRKIEQEYIHWETPSYSVRLKSR